MNYKHLGGRRPMPDKPHAGMGGTQTVMPSDGLPPVSGSDRYREGDGRIMALFPQAVDSSGNPRLSNDAGSANTTWGQFVSGFLAVPKAGRRIQFVYDNSAAVGVFSYFRLRYNSLLQTEWIRITQTGAFFSFTPLSPGGPASSVSQSDTFIPAPPPVFEIDFDTVELWTSGSCKLQAIIAIGDARML